MEIERMKANGVMSYQGSAAVSSVSQENQPVSAEEVQKEAAPQTVSLQSAGKQNGENINIGEEPKTNQSAQLKSAVNDLNRQMKDSEAIFGIHEKTNRVTIKIVDRKTKEVIKEYPPEQTLDMIAKVWEVAGILVDEKR